MLEPSGSTMATSPPTGVLASNSADGGSVLDQLRFLLYHLLLPGGKASAERAAAGKLVAAIEGFANAHA